MLFPLFSLVFSCFRASRCIFSESGGARWEVPIYGKVMKSNENKQLPISLLTFLAFK